MREVAVEVEENSKRMIKKSKLSMRTEAIASAGAEGCCNIDERRRERPSMTHPSTSSEGRRRKVQ